LNELALFAGAGGGILGGKLLGWRTVCAVEFEPYAACVLAQRQNDGLLAPFPIWDDVRTFDGAPWRGVVDVVSGGFPCQDISAAGTGKGLEGQRSGLWVEMARIIGEIRPRFVLVENSPMLTSRGLGTVLGDLAALGFDARWGVLGAADVGAPHQRDRIWIVANAELPERWPPSAGRCGDSRRQDTNCLQERQENAGRPGTGREVVAHTDQERRNGRPRQPRQSGWPESAHGSFEMAHAEGERRGKARKLRRDEPAERAACSGKTLHDSNGLDRLEVWRKAQGESRHPGQPDSRDREHGTNLDWPIEPDVGRVAYGVAGRVDRLKALGNGQVPKCAAEAWRLLTR